MKLTINESFIPFTISAIFRSAFVGILIISFFFSFISCSDNKTTNSGTDTFEMKATVNNAEWVSSAVFEVVVMYDIKTLVITGEKSNGDKITLAISSKVEKGAYELNITDYAGYTVNSEIFVSKTGNVVISRLEPTICEGTFEFEAASASSNSTASIKSGKFKAKVK